MGSKRGKQMKKLRKLKRGDTIFHSALGTQKVYITDYNDNDGLCIKVHHKWYGVDGESKSLNGEKVLFNDENEYSSMGNF